MSVFLSRHFYLVHLVVLGLGAMLAGHGAARLAAAALLAPPPEKKRRSSKARSVKGQTSDEPRLRKGLPEVVGRNIFCSYCRPGKDADEKEAVAEPEEAATLEDVALLATMIAPDDDYWTIATLQVEKPPRVMLVKKGEIFRGAIITDIEESRVAYERDGKVGYIDYEADAPRPRRGPRRPRPRRPSRRSDLSRGIKKVGKNRYQVDRSLIQKLGANPALLARQASLRPHTSGGKMDGFQIRRLRRGSALRHLGLRPGDVISHVNNKAVDSPDKVLQLYTMLPGARHVSLTVLRGGKPVTFDYNVK